MQISISNNPYNVFSEFSEQRIFEEYIYKMEVSMFNSLKEITDRCKSDGKEFWQIILEDDMSDRNVDKEDSMSKMKKNCGMLCIMRQ